MNTSFVSSRTRYSSPIHITCVGLIALGGMMIGTGMAIASDDQGANPKADSPEFLPRRSAIERKILDVLEKPTEVTFHNNDLLMAIDHLKELHGIDIWVDEAQIARKDITVSVESSKISLRACLNLMLEPNGLCFLIEDDVLKITTLTSGDAKLITRTYPVGDLFTTPDEARELTQVLECGLGLNRCEDAARTLIVSTRSRAIIARQSHRIHDQLLQLLRDLREAPNASPVATARRTFTTAGSPKVESDPFERPKEKR